MLDDDFDSGDDEFQWDPELLFSQATRIDVERIWLDGEPNWFLIFYRYAPVLAPDGSMANGAELVAYRADAEGRVENWDKRYSSDGLTRGLAYSRLTFRMVNGLAELDRRPASISHFDAYRLDSLM